MSDTTRTHHKPYRFWYISHTFFGQQAPTKQAEIGISSIFRISYNLFLFFLKHLADNNYTR